MEYTRHRWLFLITATFFSLIGYAPYTPLTAAENASSLAKAQLQQLEGSLNGRLGVYALDTKNGAKLSYRGRESFPVCSTFKVFVAAAILKEHSKGNAGLMQKRLSYTQRDMVPHSPITEKHVAKGNMTVAELLDAMMKYSDNTATNLLMKELGGPSAITQFAKSIGHQGGFQLVNWENHLNTDPNIRYDKSTPAAMGRSLEQLALGEILPVPQRQQLQKGLLSSTTSEKCIRAGVPAGWRVGDRSGGGLYGTRTDIAVLWPPNNRPPIILAIYTTQHTKDAQWREDIIASATRIVVHWVQSHK